MHYAFAEEKEPSRETLYSSIQAGYRAMVHIYVDPLRIRHKIYCAVHDLDACSRMTGVGGVNARATTVLMYLQSGLKKKCRSRRPSWPLP